MREKLTGLAGALALCLGACATPNGDGSGPVPFGDGAARYVSASVSDIAAGRREGVPPGESPASTALVLIASSGAINAVVTVNQNAASPADGGTMRFDNLPPLDGVPMLIKDNIETNLSEWANIRSSNSTSGWSAVGGLTRNPHALDRNACGSSSGSGAAVAAGLTPAAIGTETDGSITCPAAINGIVGFKPTVGLVSRTHIVPISHSQDTAGPMTRTVEDAAIVLGVIAGSDPADPATVEADARRVDYRAALDAGSLRGARIGVMRFATGYSTGLDRVFEENLTRLREGGAVLVDVTQVPDPAMDTAELIVLLTELKVDLNAYLASTDPRQVQTRTLADVIAFNIAEPRELALFGQELFLQAEQTKGLNDPAYVAARATSLKAAGADGIDRMMRDHAVIALIAPTTGPAWTTDVINGDHYAGAASSMPAIAGYPHLTVPMGFVRGLPVGMSFIAGRWQDAKVLSLGYAFEQLTHALRPPTFARSVEDMDETAPLVAADAATVREGL